MSRSLEQTIPPTFTDVLNAVKLNLSSELNCVEIGIIQEFDIATQSASIMLALKRVKSIDADGVRTIEERPGLFKVPCMVLFGGNSFLSMPIAPGDNCIVLFNDRQIDQWFENGGVQTPAVYRMHDISDGIAIVGIRSLQNSISDYLADGIRISYNSSSRVDITEDQIDSLVQLFKQTGNMEITGNLLVGGNAHIVGGLQVDGVVTGSGGGGTISINANVTLGSGKTLEAPIVNSGNGATGTFTNSVTVVDGIVTAGS